jgi:hypothetical protein
MGLSPVEGQFRARLDDMCYAVVGCWRVSLSEMQGMAKRPLSLTNACVVILDLTF